MNVVHPCDNECSEEAHEIHSVETIRKRVSVGCAEAVEASADLG